MGCFQSKKQFETFMNQPKEDKCLGFEPVGKMTDSQRVAQKFVDIRTVTEATRPLSLKP